MQEITKLKTILEGFIESFAAQAKRKKNLTFTNNDCYTLINL